MWLHRLTAMSGKQRVRGVHVAVRWLFVQNQEWLKSIVEGVEMAKELRKRTEYSLSSKPAMQ